MTRTTVLLLLAALVASIAAFADSFSEAFIEGQYNRITPAICLVKYSAEVTSAAGEASRRDITAPGILVSAEGLVMTHGHMVMENSTPSNIRVVVGEGENEREFSATLLKKPEDVNLVFLQIDRPGGVSLPYIAFPEEQPLKVGDEVLIFGVMTEPFDYSRIVNTRRIGSILTKPRLTYALDTMAGFGFMAMPAVNADGQLVGVVGFDLAPDEGGELYIRHGHPLLYQTSLFKKYIQHPPSTESVHDTEQDGWLGILTQPLTDDFAEYWNLPKEGGVIVSTVVAGSPAATAGLQAGDVIVSADGVPVRAKTDREVFAFTKLIREMGPDQEVTLKLYRNGQLMTVPAVVEDRPKSARDAGEHVDPVFGVTVRELTTDVRLLLNLEDDSQGVIVRRVTSGSPADLANMRPGVVILRIGDYNVNSIDDYKAAIEKLQKEKPAEIPVFARYRTVTGFFRIEPRWPADGE